MIHKHKLVNRSLVVEHLRVEHVWHGMLLTGWADGVAEDSARLSDGSYFLETSELLAVHRELHLLESLEKTLL